MSTIVCHHTAEALSLLFIPVEVSSLYGEMRWAWNHLHHLKKTENDDQPRNNEQWIGWDKKKYLTSNVDFTITS